MNFWIVIFLLSLVIVGLGLVIFFNISKTSKSGKPVILIGVLLPLFVAYSYGETLIKIFSPQLTIIDISGLLLLGIISGIFIASYFLIDKIN